MHVMTTRNKKGHVWHGLVETYWDKQLKQSRKRTLLTLTGFPDEVIEALRELLGKRNKAKAKAKAKTKAKAVSSPQLGVARSHGGVSAVLGTIERIGLDRLLAEERGWRRSLALAMLVSRVLSPGPKLGVEDEVGECGNSTLGLLLGIEGASADSLYATMDWLLERQPEVEQALARRHLADGELVLYDVTSSYFEGEKCGLAKFGHSRDGRRDRAQVVYGLLCSASGCPVAVEAFAGNTADPRTLSSQVKKLSEGYGLKRIALVGDRGMLTKARIREDLAPAGINWVTALGTHSLRKLVEQGDLETRAPDDPELATVTSTLYPGERLVVCRNPELAKRRKHTREALLERAEAGIRKHAEKYARGSIDRDTLNRHIGSLARLRMGKHFRHTFAPVSEKFSWERDQDSIDTEAALDGVYVVRTNLPEDQLGEDDAVRAYKSLARVERAFRSIKSILRVRPIRHHQERRVRAHLFLCMLAYHVEWHMRESLRPMLFTDPAPRDARHSPVAPVERSAEAKRRDSTRKNADGSRVYAFPRLLRHLKSFVAVTVKTGDSTMFVPNLSAITEDQRKAFELLGIEPHPVLGVLGNSLHVPQTGKAGQGTRAI